MSLFSLISFRKLPFLLLLLFCSQVNYAKYKDFVKYCASSHEMNAKEAYTLRALKNKFQESRCDRLAAILNGRSSLWLTGLEIESIRFLEFFSHFVRLDLSDNHVRNIKPLRNLHQLTHLWLAENELEDISILSSFKSLKLLVLAENRIKDIKALKGNLSLQGLNLSNNWISDISPLQNHEELNFIFLANNMVEDLTSIAYLPDAGRFKHWSQLSQIQKQESINWQKLVEEELMPQRRFRIFELGENPLGRSSWHGGLAKSLKNCPIDSSFRDIRDFCRF